MKRIVLCAIAAVLALALVGCGQQEAAAPAADNTAAPAQQAPASDAAGADDAVESDRDGELAHDAEDFAHEAAKPRIIGYTGGRVEADTNRFFVSKVYLLKEHRGRGLIASVVRFYERLCRERGLDAMYLTVNKGNEMAIRAYKKHGFEIIDAVETDIGEGFVMNDYIMEKKLK